MVNFMVCEICINKAFIKKGNKFKGKKQLSFFQRAHLLCPKFLEKVKKKKDKNKE